MATNSADFSSAFGVVGTSLTVTSDVTTSPDGGTNADSVVESAATEIHYAIKDFSITGNATYSFSVFVKNFSGSRYVGLRISNTTWTNRITAVFNPSTGTWANEPSTSGTATGATGAIQDAGNGWYRVTITGLPDPAAATVRLTVALSNSSASSLPSYAGDGTSGVYIWGAQLEAGAFPTSYIPTTVAQVTRQVDVASVNTLSPWFNASEGTLFAEGTVVNNISGTTARAFGYFANTPSPTTDIFSVEARSATSTRARIVTGGVTVTASDTVDVLGVNAKLAGAYGADGATICVNGGSPVTLASSLPSVNVLALGQNTVPTTGSIANGYLRRITYYPRKLSSAELQAITS